MKRLFIIGAGGFGRELEVYLDRISKEDRDWELSGFIDDDLSALDNFPSNYEVLGRVEDFDFKIDDYVVIAIADPSVKKKIHSFLKDKVTFYTFIHSSALVGKYIKIGEGSIICPNCIITSNVQLGCCSILNIGTQIGHDVILGNYCSFMPNVDIGGETVIGDNLYMGSNSTIINRKNIVSDVIIGAGGIVVKDIVEKGVYVGNPTIKIK